VDGLFEMKKLLRGRLIRQHLKKQKAESRTKPTDSLSEPGCAGWRAAMNP